VSKKIKSTNTNKKKNIAKGSKQKVSDWPTKRNVLFRPERLKYVRKMVKDEGCVFCISSKSKMSTETLCVYKTKYSQIILNKYPYNSGHLLILPLDHVGDLLALSPERYEDLHLALRLAVEAIKNIYEPTGYNVGLNNGSAAGAGIPDHLHYHVIPRWNGDLNFFPLIGETKVVVETLEDSYTRFLNYFNKVK
jgi:ATP adenylyltransferase